MNSRVQTLLWAQWRAWLNYYPRSNRTGAVFGPALMLLWYGMWLALAALTARVFAEPENAGMTATVLPSALFFVFIYWQAIPVLLASTGVSLEMKKLQVYPIPGSHLFLLDLMLRVTASFEMLLLMCGLGAGLLANPRLPKWSALGIVPFIVFNLCVAAGVREILIRLLARKRIREAVVLLLVSLAAVPQVLVVTGAWQKLRLMAGGFSQPLWPWSATAAVAGGRLTPLVILAGWTALAYVFGRRQFERSLNFDEAEASATTVSRGRSGERRLADRILRWPSLIFQDPLAALIEKELRFLARAPRFRLVFTMGFTFGLVIWLPVSFGRQHDSPGVFANNYLTFVCLYALLLLGDVCFWNSLGFDRAASQAYWAMPVEFSRVLIAKNITALFFVLLEIGLITAACAVLRMPLDARRIVEAFSLTVVVSTYLVGLGNLTSVTAPRAINPAKPMRSGAPGKLQAMLLLLYPLAAIPVLLSFGARYAFESEAAFFAVLGVSGLAGAAVYWVALESAVEAASANREKILSALSQGEGIIQA
jgi:ABC-2 type transport system permease protein